MNIRNPEELLSHADFVRYLARSLVYDENKAADVAQDTLVAGLERPPAEDKPLRAWLAGVAKNFIRKEYRGAKRRRARERVAAAAAESLAPSATEIAEREEIRRRVVEAVQSIEEPWRSVILLRYYEGLPHKEVARRLDIPLETMHTRLKRGLAALRKRLDALHDGDRSKWLSALAPLAYITDNKRHESRFLDDAESHGALPAKTFIKVIASAALVSVVSIGIWLLFLKKPNPEVLPIVMNESGISHAPNHSKNPDDASVSIAGGSSSAQDKEAVVPSSREVTWKGRLIDYDDKPKSGIPIELFPLRVDGAKNKKAISLVSADGGLFEFKNLLTGEYALWLTFPHNGKPLSREDWCRYRWGKVLFEKPGTINKDILVAEGNGGIVAGTVINDATGKPYLRTPPSYGFMDYYVGLRNLEHDHQLISEVDPDTGTFCLRNLPAENFDLYLIGPGYYSAYYSDFVDTEKTKIIRDIELHVPPLGKIHITILDFSKEEFNKLKMALEFTGRSKPCEYNIFGMDFTMEAPLGMTCVKFAYESMGTLSRSFEVKAGLTSEVVISRNDFGVEKKADGAITLCFKQSDGTPLKNVLAGFDSKIVRLLPNLTPPIKRTDQRGCLTLDAPEPGIWSAWYGAIKPEDAVAGFGSKLSFEAFPETMDFTFFHDIAIQESRDPDFRIELKVPDTTIKGTLVNKMSGKPIQDFGQIPRWVCIGNPLIPMRAAAISIAREGSDFVLRGVKPGMYGLGAAVFGFEQYQSGLITIKEGELLDLGNITLTPVGTVDIEVNDELGNPIRCWVNWDGKKGYGSIFGLDTNTISIGRKRIGNLPFGPLTFEITTREYTPQKVTVDLKPMERAKISLALKPEDRK